MDGAGTQSDFTPASFNSPLTSYCFNSPLSPYFNNAPLVQSQSNVPPFRPFSEPPCPAEPDQCAVRSSDSDPPASPNTDRSTPPNGRSTPPQPCDTPNGDSHSARQPPQQCCQLVTTPPSETSPTLATCGEPARATADAARANETHMVRTAQLFYERNCLTGVIQPQLSEDQVSAGQCTTVTSEVPLAQLPHCGTPQTRHGRHTALRALRGHCAQFGHFPSPGE